MYLSSRDLAAPIGVMMESYSRSILVFHYSVGDDVLTTLRSEGEGGENIAIEVLVQRKCAGGRAKFSC